MVLEITVGLLLSLLAMPVLGYAFALPDRLRKREEPKREEPDGPSPVPALGDVPAPDAEVVGLSEPVVAPPEPVVPPVEARPTAPAPTALRTRLAGTKEALVGRLSGFLGTRIVDEGLLEELEAILFTADLGVKTAESLLDAVRSEASGAPAERIRAVLREAILGKLRRVEPGPESWQTTQSPHVVLVLGVNGSGKTTTIGKLASRYESEGKKVILGAGDTFRAAAAEQLEVWAKRANCEIVKGNPGGDPASVAFDTVKAAIARRADVALIDTAGRLQTRSDLMAELTKISKVIGRELPGAPHESLLVLDANTGQNAISQAKLFTEATEVTGLALTKLDGTAKGGVIVGLADEFAIPVRYVGVGEGVEDLRDFEAEAFVDAIFAA